MGVVPGRGHDLVRDVRGADQVALGLHRDALGSVKHSLDASTRDEHGDAVDEIVKGVGTLLSVEVRGGGVVGSLGFEHDPSRLIPRGLDRDAENLRAVVHGSLGRPQHRPAGFDHRHVVLTPAVLEGRGGHAHEVTLDHALHVRE